MCKSTWVMCWKPSCMSFIGRLTHYCTCGHHRQTFQGFLCHTDIGTLPSVFTLRRANDATGLPCDQSTVDLGCMQTGEGCFAHLVTGIMLAG